MPEMARKLGKMMSDFRNTANEFKSTWEREVNFEEEERAMRTGTIQTEPKPVARTNSMLPDSEQEELTLPEVRAADPAVFDKLPAEQAVVAPQTAGTKPATDLSSKENWL